ncbi:GNAT family N-acetyltransferase [Arsenicicoccus sp. oral taxon 190]|uniref:GNAT family N-acetyltransferase n=1 Tax=Arsenicicoccus sp. oral taxon 190 TaxID=1658671 RepID=UPI000A794270|nr:GNAT family N-acetyltransferase [Arsenicicoccus sp. oral taxon 190]
MTDEIDVPAPTPDIPDGLRVVPLSEQTWDAFAELVERNNGIFGGCWCIGYHPECGQRLDHRRVKRDRVLDDAAHAALVLDQEGRAQAWAQYGDPHELSGIKHRRAYDQEPPPAPDWRLTCVYVDPRHRGQGLARRAVVGALALVAAAGGGVVEAISEVTDGRTAQGRFLFSATAELLEDLGFTRVRQVGKHAWIMTRTVEPAAPDPGPPARRVVTWDTTPAQDSPAAGG